MKILLTASLCLLSPIVLAEEATHEASALVQIHPVNSSLLLKSKESPNFIENQTIIMTCGEAVEEVAKTIGIPAPEIKTSIKAERLPGTDMIRVTAHTNDQNKSKEIVEGILHAYISRRNLLTNQRELATLEALNGELQNQGDIVQENRKSFTVLIQQYGIPFFQGSEKQIIGKSEQENHRMSELKLEKLKLEKTLQYVAAKKFINTDAQKILRTISAFDLPPNSIAELYRKHQEATRKAEDMKNRGIGSSHPEFQAAQAEAKNLVISAREEVSNLKDALNSRLSIMDQKIDHLEKFVSKRKDMAVDLSLQQHEYHVTKQLYEKSLKQYHEMQELQQRARIQLKMPRTPLTIHTKTP